ncbi:hypothetical protein ACIBG7_04035 [Nonomuraea sp. NPDC050328]|uniref:hypothetical protein n=1 Tax=Nonomuraea sp. NPDC050328 TaxID=3364361 RepID=UPI0037B66D8F
MKRIIAGVAAAAASLLLFAAPAQAAPARAAAPDPVAALKKAYAEGRGVKIKESSYSSSMFGKDASGTSRGVVGFGPRGVSAYDIVQRDPTLGRSHLIHVKGDTYADAKWVGDLPEGIKWVKYSGERPVAATIQPINIFDAKVLRGALAKAKLVKGGEYRGSMSFKQLATLSGQKLKGDLGKFMSKIKVSYRIFTGRSGLVSRVRSEMTMDFGLLGNLRSVVDSQYYEWGLKVKIQAPPKDEVIDAKDLNSAPADPPAYEVVPTQ